MDRITSVVNLDALKEPRGFIKFLQFFLAILAFATTTSFVTESSFSITCKNPGIVASTPKPPSTYSYKIKISYPFDINGNNEFPLDPCKINEGANKGKFVRPYGDFSSASQFYVFVGVMAFLYSVFAIIIYVYFWQKFNEISKLHIIDLFITIGFTVLWLVASCAWADNFTKLRHYSDPADLFPNSGIHHMVGCEKDNVKAICNNVLIGEFGKIYASIIFGFLNVFVWIGNCWFLYKESPFFHGNDQDIMAATDDVEKIQDGSGYNSSYQQQQYPSGGDGGY